MKYILYMFLINAVYLILFPLHLNIFIRVFISIITIFYFIKIEKHPIQKIIIITIR